MGKEVEALEMSQEEINQALLEKEHVRMRVQNELLSEWTVYKGTSSFYYNFLYFGAASTNLLFFSDFAIEDMVKAGKLEYIGRNKDYNNTLYKIIGLDLLLVKCRGHRYFITDLDMKDFIMNNRIFAHNSKGRVEQLNKSGAREKVRCSVNGKIYNLEDIITGNEAIGEKKGTEVHHKSKTWNLTKSNLIKVSEEQHKEIHKEVGILGFNTGYSGLTYAEAMRFFLQLENSFK